MDLHVHLAVMGTLLWSLPAGGAAGRDEAPAPKPSTAPTTQSAAGRFVLPLTKVAPQPLWQYSLAELRRMFPAFKHARFSTAGFNHFVLPFHYEGRGGEADANEANAFSFLLSDALDWAPGCYCSRHAYFCFKRSRAYMSKLAVKYDPKLIEHALDDWRASHALGGKLVRQDGGYSGTLMIYDRTGWLAVQTDYDRPRGFFELLGDMCVDAMKSLGHEPSQALVKHLHARQCKHRESLIDLGRAAWAKEKSPQAFAIYDRILQRDPGFATVRYWRANQKAWVDGDKRTKALENGRALDSFLVQAALWDFSPGNCPDVMLVAHYALWLKQAEQLIGPDAPIFLRKRLSDARKKRRISPELLQQATSVAGGYPNDYWLLFDLGRVYDYGAGLRADCDMAASIQLAALGNLYLPGMGHKRDALRGLANSVQGLGHADVAVLLLLPPTTRGLKDQGARGIRQQAGTLGRALFEMGRFEESWQWYRLAFKGYGAGERRGIQSLVEGAVSAAHAGRADVIQQILRDHGELLKSHKAEGVVRSYLLMLNGKPMDDPAVWTGGTSVPYWLLRQREIITMQSQLMYEPRVDMHRPNEWVGKNMYSRTCRILAHESYRKHPDRRVDCLYQAMEWLSPNDPWVRRVVKEWRRSVPRPNLSDPQKILKRLVDNDYRPLRDPQPDPPRQVKAWRLRRAFLPGTIACAVRKLLAAGKYDKAEELARRLLHLAVVSGDYGTRVHANHLIHLVHRAPRLRDGALSPDDL